MSCRADGRQAGSTGDALPVTAFRTRCKHHLNSPHLDEAVSAAWPQKRHESVVIKRVEAICARSERRLRGLLAPPT
jgi:hypothetical protein